MASRNTYAAALNAKECYIFSDVDGVYTADPNKIEYAKKLPALSYNEMMEISSEGAKVLHNRCAEIKVLDILENEKLEILEFNVSESKISIEFKQIIDEEILNRINQIISI